MQRIDLHAHTHHSDGTDSPTALVALAHETGLGMLAVTDHDTFAGVAEARRAAAPLGLEVICGCEITAKIPDGIIHLLAYDFDEQDEALRDLLCRIREGREARTDAILEKLSTLGVPVTRADVAAETQGKVVARPHIARAMVRKGYVAEAQDAFKHYLADDGPAYAPVEAPRPETVLDVVREAGGVSVFAHPRSLRLPGRARYRTLFRDLKPHGLTGIEVDHPSHTPEDRARFGSLARELDLVHSGGSDYHGEMKPWIRLGEGDGTIEVSSETWSRLSERRAAAR